MYNLLYHNVSAFLLAFMVLCAFPRVACSFQSSSEASSLTEWQERARIYERENRRDSTAITLFCTLARIMANHNPQQALRYAERAIECASVMPAVSLALKAEAHLAKAVALRLQGKSKEALSLLTDTTLRIQSYSHTSTLLSDVYATLGWIYADFSKRRESLQYFQQSLRHAEKANDTMRSVQALSGIAQNAIILADTSANRHIRHLLQYAREHSSNQRIQAEASLVQAQYYVRLSDYSRALRHALETLRIYEQLQEDVHISRALLLVINVYTFQFETSPDEAKKAHEYMLRARLLNERLGNKQALVDIDNFIGLAFESQHRYDSALVYHQQSLDKAQELGSPANIITGYTNTGILLWRLGNPKEGLERLKKALRTTEEYGLVRFMIVPLVRISSILRTEGKYRAREALPYSLRAVHIADSIGNRARKSYALTELAAVYDSLDQIRDAYRALQMAFLLKDTLFAAETTEKSLQLQARYETERKDNEILLLHKDKELQLLMLRQQRVVQYSLVVLLVAALIAIVIFAWLYRQKQQSALEILRQQTILEQQTAEIEYANETLHEQNEQLRTLNQEKNNIMGIVSHDLKNPISAMRGFAELLHTSESASAEEVNLISGQMIKTSERMLTLVKNLLDANRLESGEVEFSMQRCPLASLVESVVQQYHAHAAQKHIKVHCENTTTTSSILADEQAVVRILDNLVSNAVKYSPKGANVYVRLRQREEQSSSFIRLEVQDEGAGISEEDQKKLFGKFVRLSAQPTGNEHSTGLGLSIAKQLVEAMNGQVWCESETGKGAVFIVEFPAFHSKTSSETTPSTTITPSDTQNSEK